MRKWCDRLDMRIKFHLRFLIALGMLPARRLDIGRGPEAGMAGQGVPRGRTGDECVGGVEFAFGGILAREVPTPDPVSAFMVEESLSE